MTARTCPVFLVLEARIKELKIKFIQDQVVAEASDPLFAADLDMLAAFRLLVHAEIEEFLENKAREGLDAMERTFKAGNQAIRENFCLIVMGAMLEIPPRVEIDQWSAYASEVLASARSAIKKNNGIKEHSFQRLVVFCGKMPDETDIALASALNTYGKCRGDVAHNSVKSVRTIRAPSAELKDAEDLLTGLCTFFH